MSTGRDNAASDVSVAAILAAFRESGDAVVAQFSGPGGTCLGAHANGVRPLGIEWDDAACATRRAVGLPTLQADVSQLDPADFAPLKGLIGTPPCQAFSNAGKGIGRDYVGEIAACLDDLAAGRDTRAEHTAACGDDRAMLVVEPLRWALALRPRWVALEQVPPVLVIWEVVAKHLRDVGYWVWTGVLASETFGVPQTRKRAFLIASLDGPVQPPAPTHQTYRPGEPACETEATLLGPGLKPWVSMAEALGWGMDERPCVTLTTRESGGGAIGSVLDGGSGSRATVKREREALGVPTRAGCGHD